jgi:hypothetical protein
MLGIFINRLKYIKQLFLRLPINKQFSQTTLNINMQFSTVLLALVASFCILDSTSAFPTPSAVSVAQLGAGHVQLEKRFWRKAKAFLSKAKDMALANKDLLGKAMNQASKVAADQANKDSNSFISKTAKGFQSLENAAGSDLGRTIGRSI